jgi:hypothetical protein
MPLASLWAKLDRAFRAQTPPAVEDDFAVRIRSDLKRRTEDLLRSSEARMDPRTVREVLRLASVLELYERAIPPRAQKGRGVLVALGIGAAVFLMFYLRPEIADLEADLSTELVRFQLTREQPLIDPIRVGWLGVSNIRSITNGSDGRITGASEWVAVPHPDSGSVTLRELRFPRHTRLQISLAPSGRFLILEADSAPVSLIAEVQGRVDLRPSKQWNEEFVAPEPFEIEAGPGGVVLQLGAVGTDGAIRSRRLAVSDFQPGGIRDDATRDTVLVAGSLDFLRSGSGEIPIAADLGFRMERASGLLLIQAHRDSLNLRLLGRTGSARNGERELVPSVLDLLRSRPEIVVLGVILIPLLLTITQVRSLLKDLE